MEEVWKDIEGYNRGYEISNLGRVKTNKRRDITIIKPFEYKGYYYIRLYNKGKKKRYSIHTLVWDHFGDRKRNGHILQVDHIDENKLNNRIDNLQLLSNADNCRKHWNRELMKGNKVRILII